MLPPTLPVMSMAAPKGNNYAMKYKTPEERQELCRKYIEHIEQGFSDESFPECDEETLQRYIRDFPKDFGADQIMKAKKKRMLFWERVGKQGTIGQIKGFNAKSWEFNMKNRFRWTDRREVKQETKTEVNLTSDISDEDFKKLMSLHAANQATKEDSSS